MEKQIEYKPQVRPAKRKAVMVGIVIAAILLIVLSILQLASPKRSVAAYCQVYKAEKARLAKLPGNTWPSGVFNDVVGDAGEYATSFSKLDNVAPDEIRGDVAALESVYQKIHDNPSQAISASLSGATADTSLKQWTADHCDQ